jgi:hypothetical protein
MRTTGTYAYGVNVNQHADATIANVQIAIAGTNVHGIWVFGEDSMPVGSTANTKGTGAISIFIQFDGSASLDGNYQCQQGFLPINLSMFFGNFLQVLRRNRRYLGLVIKHYQPRDL